MHRDGDTKLETFENITPNYGGRETHGAVSRPPSQNTFVILLVSDTADEHRLLNQRSSLNTVRALSHALALLLF
jgi:hypothetical protein